MNRPFRGTPRMRPSGRRIPVFQSRSVWKSPRMTSPTLDTEPSPDAPVSGMLSLPADEMRRLGYAVVDMLVEHFAGIEGKPVTRLPSAEQPGFSEAAGVLLESLGREFSD